MVIPLGMDAITETASFGVDPPHEVTDRAKLAALTEDMATHGWRGAPIVVDGEQALTGSHRIAAVVALWNTEGMEIPIPRVEISELCELVELDWPALAAEFEDRHEAAAALQLLLPRNVVEYLGYDVDGAL